MPYAEGRVFFDADSHLMETPGWLLPHADPAIRERLKEFGDDAQVQRATAAVEEARVRATDPAAREAAEVAMLNTKGWESFGAVDPAERSRSLDLLGFDAQLVFSTYGPNQFREGNDLELLYGGTRAHNRAMAAFCADDPRLMAVGYIPLDDPAQAIAALDDLLTTDCDSVLIPSEPTGGISPSHPDYDPFWARLQDADMPFTLHIGGGGQTIHPAFHENGRPKPPDFLGGGENIRSRDFMTLQNPPETFLSVLVLDGVFERFPTLRCGVIEQGAMWVVPWLRRLDLAPMFFGHSEPDLRALSLKPSEYVRRQVTFTPFFLEPVGWLIEQAGPELFLFSSDFPHPEGGRDPLAAFEGSMGSASEEAKEAFYSGNFARLMGSRLAAKVPAAV